jgi:probable blue pigment (indigoidine) exporter
MTAESAATPAAVADRHTGGWGYLAALTPIIFGTTYLLTTEFLPPNRPLLAGLMRSLPTGLVLIIGSRIPPRRWMARFFVLSVLYASGLFPLLFIAAYRLPGGVAAVINSLSPLLVVVISVPLLHTRIRGIQVIAGILGAVGVALLVLRSDARLDVVGLIAMAGAVIMFSAATVLTKRWGRPEGMTSVGVTGWTFLFAGLTLLPVTLLIEGLPNDLTTRNIGGLIYLVLISGILAYALWFWGLHRLSASAVTFLTLLNPVTAALLGWVVLDQRLNAWQLLGAVIILISVVMGQPGIFEQRFDKRRSRVSERRVERAPPRGH